MASQCADQYLSLCLWKRWYFLLREFEKNMNSIDALSLVSLSPSHRLDAPGTWSSISTRYYLIFKDYSKSSIWHSIPTHACNALKDEYLIHSHVSHCLRMFIWVTWYIIIYWLTDWWLMRFDENCWQTVFRLKLNLSSEHRTRTEPPYANLIKTLCTLSCKMCKSKLKQHCQILPAYKDMKLETTLSDRLRWVVFIRIHWISRSCPDTVGHAVDISGLCGVMLTSWRRWTTLAMPGWQATRVAPWMGTPTRANMTSFWWNSMPRASTCGRASVVVRAGMRLRLWRRTGCDVVFLAISCDIFHGAKLQNSLGGRCSESCGVASPLKWINLLCAFTRFDISYLVKCLMEVWAMNFD